MTIRYTSDARSALACFRDRLNRIVGPPFTEPGPAPQRGAFGRDGDTPAVELPRELVAGRQVERLAHFLRHGRLPCGITTRPERPSVLRSGKLLNGVQEAPPSGRLDHEEPALARHG